MKQFIKTLSLRWISKECQEAFFSALGSPDYKEFGRLWDSHPDWQLDFGKAISCCLDVLAESGTTDCGLKAFWIPEYALEAMAELKSKDHTWVDFLKDSSVCCTMAVFEDTCLEIERPWGRCCQNTVSTEECEDTLGSQSEFSHSGKSPNNEFQATGGSGFETSIILNKTCLPRGLGPQPKVQDETTAVDSGNQWDISSISYGEKLTFGKEGAFKIIAPISHTSLLVTWKANYNIFSPLKRKSAERHHYEYIRDEELENNPIRVFVLSRSRSPGIGISRTKQGKLPATNVSWMSRKDSPATNKISVLAEEVPRLRKDAVDIRTVTVVNGEESEQDRQKDGRVALNTVESVLLQSSPGVK
jgi:hypothetical protein